VLSRESLKAITVLRGGAGNQLFQLCAALRARQLGWSTTLSSSALSSDQLRGLEIGALATNLGFAFEKSSHISQSRWFKLLGRRKVVISDPPGEFGDLGQLLSAPIGESIIIDGYFQHLANVLPFKDVMRNGMNTQFPGSQIDFDAIAVHARRGDYVKNPKNIGFYQELDLNYYTHALEIQLSQTNLRNVMLYSDDPSWLADQLSPELARRFPEIQFSIRHPTKTSGLDEIAYMSQFPAFVIANSTFSWWIAFLSQSEYVVGPQKWFRRDLAPNVESLFVKNWLWL